MLAIHVVAEVRHAIAASSASSRTGRGACLWTAAIIRIVYGVWERSMEWLELRDGARFGPWSWLSRVVVKAAGVPAVFAEAGHAEKITGTDHCSGCWCLERRIWVTPRRLGSRDAGRRRGLLVRLLGTCRYCWQVDCDSNLRRTAFFRRFPSCWNGCATALSRRGPILKVAEVVVIVIDRCRLTL